MRGRFAWLGAASCCCAVGGLATVGTQDTWLDGYGIIAYGLVPLAFIPLSAGAIAESARQPVRRERLHRARSSAATGSSPRSWCSSRWRPPTTWRWCRCCWCTSRTWACRSCWADSCSGRPASCSPSVAIGTLIGVLFIGRSIAAPAARRHGRAARLRGPRAAAGADGGAEATARRAPATSRCESRGAAQERARVHARGGQHSRHDARGRGSACWRSCVGALRVWRRGCFCARRASKRGRRRAAQRWTIALGDGRAGRSCP